MGSIIYIKYITNVILCRSEFIAVAPKSAIALHVKGHHLPTDSTEIQAHTNFTKYTELNFSTHPLMNVLHAYPVMDMGHCYRISYFTLSIDAKLILERSIWDKPFWESCRKFRITGSRCYELFTYNKIKKTEEQWSLKASRYFWPKPFSNEAVRYGLEYEI